ncbi:hypothetical protein FHU41_002562 [Psychromicrobium silvestre]|uniref:Uncharacterized protein n=1 Tax=Psychromicrobium silvestre TaxID=1645614 RepID=A0A7Y9LVD9_9MICC|nr:hypothetical protein [Psychromicrobium silvestre]NYE96312.1 hypothetical protein [Psychromicrobium silvestre]
MIEDLSIRNVDARPGYPFHDSVELPGWENRSVWGYDIPSQTFYAQLWSNASTRKDPDLWLSGVTERYPWPACIALRIFSSLEVNPIEAVNALGIGSVDEPMRSKLEIFAKFEDFDGTSDYERGATQALQWLLGESQVTPGSQEAWYQTSPGRDYVNAEWHMVTGRIYLEPNNEFVKGVDEILSWMQDLR